MTHPRMRPPFLLVALLLPLVIACSSANEATSPAPSASAAASPSTSASASPSASASGANTASPAPSGAPAAGTPGGTLVDLVGGTPTVDNAPAVFNADQARQYSGVTLRFYGSGPGIGGDLDAALEGRFLQETGIQIQHFPNPNSASETYSNFQRFFQAQSPDVDAMMIDVIWPGAFAPHLADLTQAFAQEAQQHYPTIVENNTIDGKLVAIPWFGDFGMLYYRTDMLQKYGFDGPPETWDELEQMARTIQDGEQQAGNPNFYGFVFQGNAYEGLTCDALEWIASTTGQGFFQNGELALDDPRVADMLRKVQGWVGTIAPRGVTGYQEDQSNNIFAQGNAAFLRNWPYAYALGQQEGSPIKGKFDVAPLPHAEGQQPVGTVGGWQIAVSRYSQHQEAAIEFVRYMTSPQVQAYRAAIGSFVPTIPSVAEEEAVVQAMPFLPAFDEVVRVARPSDELRDRYNQGSTYIFQSMNLILNGRDPAQILPQIAPQFQRILLEE